MSKLFNILLTGIVAVGFLTGCQSEEGLTGEGKVSFKVEINGEVKELSRGIEEDNLAQNCTIYIYNSEALIRKYHGVGELPSELVLVSGDYSAVAWAGDSVAASFTKKYYKGISPFSITRGANVETTVVCKIANTVASVNFDASAANALSNYKLTIANAKGSLDFTADNISEKGYYMMSAGDKDLTWTLTGTQTNGVAYTQTGTISNTKRATEYALHFSYNPDEQNFGGGLFTVDVDESAIEMEDSIVLTSAPKIIGSGFDIKSPIFAEQKALKKTSFYVSSTSALQGLEISCSYFPTLGFSGNSFNFRTMTVEARETIEALGITETYNYDAIKDEAISKVTLAKDLLDKLPNGTYRINIKATDATNKITLETLVFEISDASVMTVEAQPKDIHQYSAIIRANIAKDGVTGCGFNYRKKGDASWTTVMGVIDGSTYAIRLTNLTPATTYQFVAISDGYIAQNVCEFTTGSAIALSNGGFEDWFTDGDKALVPGISANDMLWDTGNHGSITLSVNITNPDESLKHTGKYSIKMKSAYVALMGIGKFAAGNVFIGKYLKTDGTNGILGFGRPFNSRPKALHGYIRYTPGAIDYSSSEVPDAPKGSTDKGIVYIALLDETTESYNGSNWSMIIKTKKAERRLFDKNESKVIGYGEKIWASATEGDNFIEFTIPIDYKTDKIPTNLLIVGSASMYGDYFVGSTSSTMWLDDLEFIYE